MHVTINVYPGRSIRPSLPQVRLRHRLRHARRPHQPHRRGRFATASAHGRASLAGRRVRYGRAGDGARRRQARARREVRRDNVDLRLVETGYMSPNGTGERAACYFRRVIVAHGMKTPRPFVTVQSLVSGDAGNGNKNVSRQQLICSSAAAAVGLMGNEIDALLLTIVALCFVRVAINRTPNLSN